MRKGAILRALVGMGLGLVPVQAAHAALVLYYDFNGLSQGNLANGASINDVGPDQGVNVDPGTAAWHHVAYTNDGAAGNQAIYLDGVQVAGVGVAPPNNVSAPGTGGGMDVNQNIFIGTANNGGSFSGQLDE